MINPYQPPTTPKHRGDLTQAELNEAPLVAHFLWTARVERYVLARYMLLRCSTRISCLSLGMSILAILALLDWPGPIGATPSLLRLVGVMMLTAVLYTLLIARAKRATRLHFVENGLVPGARVTVQIRPGNIHCQTFSPTGSHHACEKITEHPVYKHTGLGLLIIADLDVIFFVPREADFEGWTYREFRDAARGFRQP